MNHTHCIFRLFNELDTFFAAEQFRNHLNDPNCQELDKQFGFLNL